MALTSPDDYKKRKGVSVSSTSSNATGGLTSPDDYKARNSPERKRAAENRQYADAMGSSRLMEVENLKAEQEKERLANENMKALGMDWESQYGNDSPIAKKGEALLEAAAVRKAAEEALPSYKERVREDANKWPALLRPIGVAIEAVAEAPLMVSARQQLGTASERDKQYEPSKAAQLAGGALNTIGNITFSGSPMGGIYQGTGQALGRYAPNLANSAGGRIASSAIQGVAEGVPTNIAQELIVNPEASGEDLVVAGAVGGAFGLLPAAGRAFAEGFKGARGVAKGAAEGALGAKNPSMQGSIPATEAPASVRAVDDADPLGFVPKGEESRFTHPEDTRTYIRSGAEKEPISFENAVNNFYTNAFDNQQRINQFDKYVESVTGKPLSPEERSYYLALNSRGSDMVSNHILTEQLVNAKGDVIGQSLKDITSQIPRRAYKNFTDYLIAKHAETRMDRGETVYNRKTNMTSEKLKSKIADYDRAYPEFAKIADQLYEWNEQLTKSWLVDTGIISPEMAKAWKDANPFWVPNKRFFSKLERAGKGLGSKRGFGNQNNPVKKYSPTGSERDIIDPIESMIEYVDRYVKTAKRNEVMQTLIKNIRKDPESFGDFAVELKREKVEPGALGDDGFDKLIDSMDDEFNRTLRKSDKDKDNVISGLIDGERVYLRVNDPALLEALVNITPQARSKVLESARKATNLVKVLTTGINPIFSLTRNIFRDIPTAFIASKTTNNPVRFGWDLLDGVVSSFGNKDLYKRYKAVGGGHSSPIAADRDLLAQSKQSILPQTRRGLGLLPRAKSALENLSNVIESAPRLGEFKRLTKAGDDSYGSRVEGLYEANDITTNFKRHGTVSKEADAIFLYLNAALQGLDKTVRIFKDKPADAISKSLMAVTLPTIALYVLNHGDEAYENLSNYQKDNFFNIPKGDGTFIKIPRPREIGVPFGSAVERALREWIDKDPESFRDFSDTITNAFAPPGVPAKELAEGDFMGAAVSPLRDTIAGPLVDVAANENFAGAPIVPGYLEGASPRNQYDANTSEIGKKIGDILNVSPKQVDHLIRSYTGVVGQLGLPASSKGGTVTDMLTKQVTADPVFTTDATRFFYELKDKVDTQYQDFNVTGEAPKGYNDATRKYLDSVASDMSDITKAIRAVDDMNLSAEEAKRTKRELTEFRNTLARTAYKAVAGNQ